MPDPTPRDVETAVAATAYTEESYGPFSGGDPRDFTPDPDDTTPEERAAHAESCAKWDGEQLPPGCAYMGDGSVWTGKGFGVGMTRWQVEGDPAQVGNVASAIAAAREEGWREGMEEAVAIVRLCEKVQPCGWAVRNIRARIAAEEGG